MTNNASFPAHARGAHVSIFRCARRSARWTVSDLSEKAWLPSVLQPCIHTALALTLLGWWLLFFVVLFGGWWCRLWWWWWWLLLLILDLFGVATVAQTNCPHRFAVDDDVVDNTMTGDGKAITARFCSKCGRCPPVRGPRARTSPSRLS
ncbi:hypothetical protein B0T22DRAFT_467355 [Podospora appendiculata]|uniref:Uncharacterized protein n=1 Tax=Podospora appendiculata TaxID=314037 RepID=A0AAE1CB22_9PEZI|nr:hypothetical protein B0T22DRAFT_467355 [Podospora appendiculata]